MRWLLGALLLLAGCCSCQAPPVDPATAPPREVTYNEVQAAQNARAARLDVLVAKGIVSLRGVDEAGAPTYDQADANLQLVQPWRFALAIGKLGETRFWLGSDEERYWLLDGQQANRAYVGRHDAFTRGKAERLGLPIAPTDVVTLAGIRPIPETGVYLRWSADLGGFVFDLPAGGGTWRHVVDAETLLPRRVLLVDPEGTVVLRSTLDRYVNVRLRGDATRPPKAPGRIAIEHPMSGSEITISLDVLTDRPPRGTVFDLEDRIDGFGGLEIVDLDAPPLPPPR